MHPLPYVYPPVTHVDQWGTVSTELDPVSLSLIFGRIVLLIKVFIVSTNGNVPFLRRQRQSLRYLGLVIDSSAPLPLCPITITIFLSTRFTLAIPQ